MIRILLFAGAVVLIGAILISVLAPRTSAVPAKGDDLMPQSAKTVSYVLLLLLMFGIVTGVIGGL